MSARTFGSNAASWFCATSFSRSLGKPEIAPDLVVRTRVVIRLGVCASEIVHQIVIRKYVSRCLQPFGDSVLDSYFEPLGHAIKEAE